MSYKTITIQQEIQEYYCDFCEKKLDYCHIECSNTICQKDICVDCAVLITKDFEENYLCKECISKDHEEISKILNQIKSINNDIITESLKLEKIRQEKKIEIDKLRKQLTHFLWWGKDEGYQIYL